ncbi:hypothetical protein [Candidatus Nephthysia bennettiae]|uniref:Uncharacterized protein n=1 Tax=Candidatus Nephthysia bennettiae TaxID=3127016 RepID=A0A934N7H7_9BACT|nr:hypothetical protein [Candidatus Dormibacteraeota bacterium]
MPFYMTQFSYEGQAWSSRQRIPRIVVKALYERQFRASSKVKQDLELVSA